MATNENNTKNFTSLDATLLRELLQAQRSRCEVHHTWQRAFRDVLSGRMAPQEFQAALNPIVAALKTVSDRMRAVRDRDDGQASPYLRQWVAAIQEGERSLYEATTQIQQLMFQHIAADVTLSNDDTNMPSTSALHCADCRVAQRCAALGGAVPCTDRTLRCGEDCHVGSDSEDGADSGDASRGKAQAACAQASISLKNLDAAAARAREQVADAVDEAQEWYADLP